MKQPKIFIACDTTSIKKIKKIITNSQNSQINFGYKFGLEFLNSKSGRKFVSSLKKKITFDNQIVLKLDSAFDTDNSKGNKYNDNHQGSNNTGNNNVNSYNNITNNINNTINIKINPFGEEDLSFISKEEKLRILNKYGFYVNKISKDFYRQQIYGNNYFFF